MIAGVQPSADETHAYAVREGAAAMRDGPVTSIEHVTAA